jgi:hypothetical protein
VEKMRQTDQRIYSLGDPEKFAQYLRIKTITFNLIRKYAENHLNFELIMARRLDPLVKFQDRLVILLAIILLILLALDVNQTWLILLSILATFLMLDNKITKITAQLSDKIIIAQHETNQDFLKLKLASYGVNFSSDFLLIYDKYMQNGAIDFDNISPEDEGLISSIEYDLLKYNFDIERHLYF